MELLARQDIDPWPLLRSSRVHPFPVAVAAGRVLRAPTPSALVDACLKAAELLTRYVAGCGVASWASREDGAVRLGLRLEGDLAFGAFLGAAQQLARQSGHPLQPYLTPCRPSKRGPGKAEAPLIALVELRNELGHDLMALTDARAQGVLNDRKPVSALLEALHALEGLLALPLFVAEDCQWSKGGFELRRLLLMGESVDPPPDTLRVAAGLDERLAPYLGVDRHALQLPPMLLWRLLPSRHNRELVFLDKIRAGTPVYKSVHSGEMTGPHRLDGEWLELPRAAEEIALADGTSLSRDWGTRSSRLEAGLRQEVGRVPWGEMDDRAVQWFAKRLKDDSAMAPAALVRERLLDGRTHLEPSDLRQLTLLFGKRTAVNPVLGRPLIDLRSSGRSAERWDARDLVEDNLVSALRRAIGFIAEQLEMGAELRGEDLSATSGSPDYIAIREALVNQLIHQDYGDKSAAAQVELRPDRAIFFNPGRSLVSARLLPEGARSQSRNPLIARAFRLIGFAELAGSGIVSLQRAWRVANRPPPTFESDDTANTFSMRLSWEPMEPDVDPSWVERLGVGLRAGDAELLGLLLRAGRLTDQQAASGLDWTADKVDGAFRRLRVQALVAQEDESWRPSDSARDAWHAEE